MQAVSQGNVGRCGGCNVATEDNGKGKNSPRQADVSKQVFEIGALVEYFSLTKKIWVPAVVCGFHDFFGSYKLDIHPSAPMDRLRRRPPPISPTGIVFKAAEVVHYSTSPGRGGGEILKSTVAEDCCQPPQTPTRSGKWSARKSKQSEKIQMMERRGTPPWEREFLERMKEIAEADEGDALDAPSPGVPKATCPELSRSPLVQCSPRGSSSKQSSQRGEQTVSSSHPQPNPLGDTPKDVVDGGRHPVPSIAAGGPGRAALPPRPGGSGPGNLYKVATDTPPLPKPLVNALRRQSSPRVVQPKPGGAWPCEPTLPQCLGAAMASSSGNTLDAIGAGLRGSSDTYYGPSTSAPTQRQMGIHRSESSGARVQHVRTADVGTGCNRQSASAGARPRNRRENEAEAASRVQSADIPNTTAAALVAVGRFLGIFDPETLTMR